MVRVAGGWSSWSSFDGIGTCAAEILIPQRLVETSTGGFTWAEQSLSGSEI